MGIEQCDGMQRLDYVLHVVFSITLDQLVEDDEVNNSWRLWSDYQGPQQI